MGNTESSKPQSAPATGQTIKDTQLGSDAKPGEVAKKPACKACCACPETKLARDKCIMERGEENCKDLIEAHKECMRKMGFNI